MNGPEIREHVLAAGYRRDPAALPALRDRLLEEWGLTDDEADRVMRHLSAAGFQLVTPETCLGLALLEFSDIWAGWSASRRTQWVLDNPGPGRSPP